MSVLKQVIVTSGPGSEQGGRKKEGRGGPPTV